MAGDLCTSGLGVEIRCLVVLTEAFKDSVVLVDASRDNEISAGASKDFLEEASRD